MFARTSILQVLPRNPQMKPLAQLRSRSTNFATTRIYGAPIASGVPFRKANPRRPHPRT